MAHSILHFSTGLALATAAYIPSLTRMFSRNLPHKSTITGNFLASSYAAGIFAIIPALLHRIGLPAWFCDGWWMNIFILHPLIDKLKNGGLLLGELLFAGCLVFQYAVLMYALYSIKRTANSNR